MMLDLMKFNYPSLFARGIHPKEKIDSEIVLYDFEML